MENWPEQLNYLAQKGTFTHKPSDTNVRTDMDAGIAYVRRRFTNSPDNYTFQVLMDDFEKLVFDGFKKGVINDGADWFIMPVVIASDYVDCQVRILKDGVSWNDAGYGKWNLALQLEIRDLPTMDAASAYVVGNLGYPDPISDPLQIIVNNTYPQGIAGARSFIGF